MIPADQTLQRLRVRVETALDKRLPGSDSPQQLHAAMRYATLGGGKRIRACLTYAAGLALGVDEEALDPPACAVEMVHCYSLAHDDLPCMDDDELRRGKPSCHMAYGEATALLAGDALQSLAFHILATDAGIQAAPARRLGMIDALAGAAGVEGMAGGQAIDLDAVGKPLTLTQLEEMHGRKTGALIRAAVRLGALSSEGAGEPEFKALDGYARAIGLAFQVTDDILDVEGDTRTLGKTWGADRARNKPTYPALLGLDKARSEARRLHDNALASLAAIGDNTDLLARIADFIIERTR